jgi:hypothetical protein
MYSNQTRFKVLAAVCLVLSLPQTTQIAAAAAPADACSLLTQQQVASALGVQVDPGKSLIGPGDCRWIEPAKRPGDEVAILQINFAKAQSFETGKTPIPGWNKTPQTGIGDEAYSADSGKVTFLISPTLSVKKGSAFIVIAAKVPKASLEQTKAIEKAVALTVIEKL